MLPKFTEHSTRVWDFIANKMQFLLQAIRLVKEMGPQPEVSAGKCRGGCGNHSQSRGCRTVAVHGMCAGAGCFVEREVLKVWLELLK